MPPIAAVDNPAKVRIIYETLNTQTSNIKCAEAAVSAYTLVH